MFFFFAGGGEFELFKQFVIFLSMLPYNIKRTLKFISNFSQTIHESWGYLTKILYFSYVWVNFDLFWANSQIFSQMYPIISSYFIRISSNLQIDNCWSIVGWLQFCKINFLTKCIVYYRVLLKKQKKKRVKLLTVSSLSPNPPNWNQCKIRREI